MTLELEINAATRAFFPEGAWEYATPLKRWEVESSALRGKETVIGQLVPRSLKTKPERRNYYLVFRLESNAIDVNFITTRRCKSEENPFHLTAEEACQLSLVEAFPNSCERWFRIWTPPYPYHSFLIMFKASGVGNIYRVQGERVRLERSNFQWPHSDINSLLHATNQQFDQMALELFADEQSELKFNVQWKCLKNSERDEVAFFCKNGNWDELRHIAKWVLQFCLGQMTSLSSEEFVWHITGPINLGILTDSSRFIMDYEAIFSGWRKVLTQHFKPDYVDCDDAPYSISERISNSSLGRITCHKPTYHEFLEASLQLSRWADEHLSAEEAKRLLDF